MGAVISSENQQQKLKKCVKTKNNLIKTHKKQIDNLTRGSSKIDCVGQSVKLNYNPEDGEKKLEWMSYKQLDDCLNPFNHCIINNGSMGIIKTSGNLSMEGVTWKE